MGHLHRTTYLKGFHIVARDGEVGHVDDFLMGEDWRIRYLVVDTSNWLGGRSVLVGSAAITRIDAPNKKLYIAESRDEVRNSASLDQVDIELVETLPPFVII